MSESVTMARPSTSETDPLLILLQLEQSARRVLDSEALPFLMVNETRRLFNYRQAALISLADTSPTQALKVQAISSVSVVDRNAPMVQWLESVLAQLYTADAALTTRRFNADSVPAELALAWQEFSLPYAAWAPLRTPSGRILGGLWLVREVPWNDQELGLLTRLCETYAHAWQALPKPLGKSIFKRPVVRYVAIALLLGLFIPVRMSALAPVEVVPKQPIIVSAPLDGVIAEITIAPNEIVHEGQLLVRFEDTVLRNDYAVAEKTLAIAQAEHLRAMQGAFQDVKTNADVALLSAKVDLARAERDYARDVLGKVEVKATRTGVAIFRDPSDWDGKPVRTGERIMEIADPHHIALRINLPVKDAIALEKGVEVRAFFDADPLHPVSAKVSQASYQAEVMPGDLLAYRVDADLEEASLPENVRIGWQGTAKVYGERAPILYYLFRRPISAMRQYLGF